MENADKRPDNVLFGAGDEITIKRGARRASVTIGDKSLFGVTHIRLEIDADKPLRYCIKGEVVD